MLLSTVFHGEPLGGSVALPATVTVTDQRSNIYGFGLKEEIQNRNTAKYS